MSQDTAPQTSTASHTNTPRQRIIPNIWCNADAPNVAEAMVEAFSAGAWGSATSEVRFSYPTEGLLAFQEPFAGQPLTIQVTITGPTGDPYDVILINAGEAFGITHGVSFILNFDPLMFPGENLEAQTQTAREALNAQWSRLEATGDVIMPLGEYPMSPLYGWVSDAHGVTWQLILTDPHGEPRPFITPSLMFSGSAQNRALEALKLYSSLLPGSRLGNIVAYESQVGPAEIGSLMFGDCQVGGSWLAAMDSAVDQPSAFTPGLSLQLICDTQEEIDRLWETLSHVPEAEQCGWLEDRFGVSWQVTPDHIEELLANPGAYLALMDMKKIIIADF